MDDGEDLLVPIRPLKIKRALFVFDDPAIFSKNPLRKPNNSRPKKVNESWDRWLTNHHQSEGMVDSLLMVNWDIHVPEI